MHAALISALVLADTTTKKSGGSSALTLLFPLVLIVLGYFFLLRPARNRQRAQMHAAEQARSTITVGEEIITTSGLIATVVAKTDDEVTLEIAPGVHARYVPAAIMRSAVEEPEPDVTNHEVIEPDSGATEPPKDEPTETPDESSPS